MADSSNKTEKPTSKRIKQVRSKGQVAVSRDLSSSVGLLTGLLVLNLVGPRLFQGIKDSMARAFQSIDSLTVSYISIRQIVVTYFLPFLPYYAILLFSMAIVGLLVNGIQTRFNWASKKVGLDFKNVKLNPLAFFSRLASPAGMMEVLKSIVKLVIVGWIVFSFLKSHIPNFLELQSMGVGYAFNRWTGLAYDLAMRVAFAFIIIGILDYLFTRWNYDKQMKMSKEEVKEEHIQSEGNPVIKGAIKSKQRQMAISRMMSNMPKATVVITNPTHLAIAIQYEQNMRSPIVIAKGARLVAERIIDRAEEYEIPVVQNIPLARALYNTVEINQEIPPELYTAMAEILVYIYKLRGTLKPATSTY